MKKLFLPLVLMMGFLQLVYAQKGAISGTIIDENSGETLIGANVLIDGTTIGTSTDFDGKFQFSVEPGTYVVSVSYIGYNEKKVSDVEVKANETTYLDVALSDEAMELELDVVVTAKIIERSENAILMLQKKSDKIQDGISSQEISRLGAGDAAAALTKVTGTTIVDGKYVYVRGLGDRYSSTSLNGTRLPSIDPYRNSAQLDLIPSNLLDNIIAAKTFTPDLPGDFTGGFVDIKIKTLPERFTYNVSVSTTYNTQSSFIDDFLTFEAGDMAKFGFNDGYLDKPSALNNPRLEELNVLDRSGATAARRDNEVAELLHTTIGEFNQQLVPDAKRTPLNHSFSFNIGNQFNLGKNDLPLGVLFSMNYGKNYQHYANVTNANYTNTGTNSDMLLEDFDMLDTRSVEQSDLGGLFGLSLRPSPNNEISIYAIFSHQGFQEGRSLEGDYSVYGIARPDRLFQSRTLSFMERQLFDVVLNGSHVIPAAGNMKIEWAGSYVLGKQLEPDLRFFANTYDIDRDLYSIATSQYLAPGHYFRDLNDVSYEGKLDITLPFLQSKSNSNKIKFGGLYRTKTREFTENIYNILRSQGQAYNGDPDAYFGKGNIGVVEQTEDRNTIGLFISDDTSPIAIYDGEANIWAAYGMVTYQIASPLKVIAGARVEGTDYFVESSAAELNPNPELFRGSIDEVDLLPAVNLIYSLNDNMNIRAAYSNTLARPNMREIAPFASFGFIGDPLIFGNVNLQRSRINNLDLRYEIYMRPGEMAAVSAFYKQFKDPIVRTYRPAGNPQFTWVNTADANLYGLELEVRKGLDFISPALQNFTVSGNLALIISEVALDSVELAKNRAVDPEFPETREFQGQSPFVANANLSYTNADKGWDAIIAFNFFGDRLSATGVEGTPDIFEKGRGQLDFSVSKKFGNFQVKLRAINLLNPDFERFSEYKGERYIYTQYKRGTEFGVGLSYGF